MRALTAYALCTGSAFWTGTAVAAPSQSNPGAGYEAAPSTEPIRRQILMDVGKGQMIDLPQPLGSIIAVDPKVARVQPVSRNSFYLMGMEEGATTVVAMDTRGNLIQEFAVLIRSNIFKGAIYDPVMIEAAIHAAVGGAVDVRVGALPNGLVLTGPVSSPDESQQVMAIARAVAGDKVAIVNRMDLLSSIQVNVRVRFIEVSRQVTKQLGVNWQSLYGAGNFAFGLVTGSGLGALIPGAPAAQSLADLATRGTDSTGLTRTRPSRLTSSLSTGRFDVNAVIDALAENRMITVLAEPNLTALSGETASFLAGGEFPIPVAATASDQITIEFKQFGVSLSLVPTVLSPDRLNLRIRPEVSELTDAGSITMPLAGGTVRIPALSVRRAETTVELGSGQSFAIAGLLQNSSTQTTSGVPGLSSLPILGALFRSKNFRNDRSELVIIVTPYLVSPASSPGQLMEPAATQSGMIGSRAAGTADPSTKMPDPPSNNEGKRP